MRALVAGVTLGLCITMLSPRPRPAMAGDGAEPTELIRVPTEEMDVLLKADAKGIVLRYAEYARLVKAAEARARTLAAQPPVDGALVSCEGSLDLTHARAATLDLVYGVDVLADGPRAVGFPVAGFAIERLLVQDEDGAPAGRYEEWQGRPRLRFTGAGRRVVSLRGSAAFAKKGQQRYLDLRFPPAAAMGLTLRWPAGMEGVLVGEGAPVPVRAPTEHGVAVRARPSRTGHLRIAFAPRAKGREDGPAILDTYTGALHTVGDGLVRSRVVIRADVFRTPITTLELALPEGFAVRVLEGEGLTDFRRVDGRVRVQFAKPVLGPIALTLEGARAYRPAPGVVMPRVRVVGAVRRRGEMALRFGRDVRVRAIHVEGGRRLSAWRAKDKRGLLRYAMTRGDGRVRVDLEAGAVRLDATSNYYLNLAEAGKTLFVTTTYRVLEGTVFSLRPKMPGGYELRSLSIGGKSGGFRKDLRADGTLEVSLARGVSAGGEISLAATLEQSQADWVPDAASVQVPLTVPSAGAGREQGFLAVGADAAFHVLETTRSDLVAVGAADLTARGISAAGLVYGYRLDGPKPAVALSVERHRPVLEAAVISTLLPSARRLDVVATVAHRIRRAGVRTLEIDVPRWAGEDHVRFDSPFVRGARRLEGEASPTDVPEGYARWRVDLDQRVIGRHTTVVRYHLDLDEENWSVEADRALGVRVPLEGTRRYIVVQRAQGLEVGVPTRGSHVRAMEWTDLPPEAAVDPLAALEVLEVRGDGEGVGVRVQRHDGAAVLDAVATQVTLHTAVAREGVLRTRATVRLFNVDRQFLKMSLPSGSDLIGAIVDGEAVKVLTDPAGVLLVPIPTARRRGSSSEAAFTYETKLGAALGGHVRVPGPVFHDLEVLRTEHTVAFDPDIRVTSVAGAYGTLRTPRPRPRASWLARFFGSAGAGLKAPPQAAGTAVLDSEIADEVETEDDLDYEESFGESEGMSDAPFAAKRPAPAREPLAKDGGRVPPSQRAPGDPMPTPPPESMWRP